MVVNILINKEESSGIKELDNYINKLTYCYVLNEFLNIIRKILLLLF